MCTYRRSIDLSLLVTLFSCHWPTNSHHHNANKIKFSLLKLETFMIYYIKYLIPHGSICFFLIYGDFNNENVILT